MTDREAMAPKFSNLRMLAIAIAIIGLAGSAYGYSVSKGTMLQCYLFAFVFWMGLTMGLFGLTLIHHMIRGRWGMPVLRIWEAGSRNLLLMAIFFVPIALAIYTHHLYPWAFTPENVPHELQKHIAHKAKYFEFSFFIGRAALYFAIWLFFSSVLNRSSVRQDVTGDSEMSNSRASWAAPGIVLFVLTVTFAWTDWVMSLDPSWFSTIFGIWFVIGQGLSATAFTAILIWKWAGTKPYSDMVSEGVTRDIGNVLLTFTMFWGYISISQFLIIYSGNLGEETSYYLRRGLDPRHGASIYWFIGSAITFGQFFIPFVMLLSGKTKRSAKLLGLVATMIFTVRIFDIFWTILPFFHPDPRGSGQTVPVEIFWMSIAAWLAMGGIWLFAFVGNLKRYPLLPKHEPRLVEALEHA